ncbi:GNAT family N-acetyltransferase [Microbaculum marinum]|uniref:GNAT family N-acetyltransferase n=1 Tax=Microbaculum marinum TaxID=1764581 RepID=A0AAW9RWE9_9HYPH
MNDHVAEISILSPVELEAHLFDLADLLHACVHAGANINFVLPFSQDQAMDFWRQKVVAPARAGTRVVWVARTSGDIVGSVQLDTDTPPNQPHRAEVTKLLVHPDFRRRGIARRLMADLERHAAGLGRSLITLDTRTGDKAEPLYVSLRYTVVGTIPDFCRDPFEDRLHPTTIMYKLL